MQARDVVHAIKNRLNIVDLVRRYLDLKRVGPRWVAPCPFHNETKPSFSVNEEDGLFYCFGCQASGDIIDFYRRIKSLDFNEAVAELATEAGISIEKRQYSPRQRAEEAKKTSNRQQILKMYDLAEKHYIAALASPEAAECQTYLEKRGLSGEIIEAFGLGWARREWQSLASALQRANYSPALAVDGGLLGKSAKGKLFDRFRGRLMFPIKNLSNQTIAFGGRIIANEDEAKYINSSDTPIYKKGENLYGLVQARKGITTSKKAIITEGYMDVLTLHQYGYSNAVAVLGTALTPEQIKRLAGFGPEQILLIFDGDRAGRNAALRSSQMFLAKGMTCKVVLLPDGEDIDSFLRNRALGPEAFENLCDTAPEGMDFCLGEVKAMSPNGALDWAYKFMASVELPEIATKYASQLATHLHFSEAELRQKINRRRPGQSMQTVPAPAVAPARQLSVLERQILMVAMRYPQNIDVLRDCGAVQLCSSQAAQTLWAKVQEFGADCHYHLAPEEQVFWAECCGDEAPPRTNGENEVASLRMLLENHYKQRERASLTIALQGNRQGDFDDDLEYLRALKEGMEKKS